MDKTNWNCCSNVKGVSIASKMGKTRDALRSTQLWRHYYWSTKRITSVYNHTRMMFSSIYKSSRFVSVLGCSFARSDRDQSVELLQNAPHFFLPGTFKLHIPILINAYVYLEKSSTDLFGVKGAAAATTPLLSRKRTIYSQTRTKERGWRHREKSISLSL